jgi:hypothetical protein
MKGPIRNTEQQLDNIYYTLFWRCTALLSLFTKLMAFYQPRQPAQLCWAKTIFLSRTGTIGFYSSIFTVQDHILITAGDALSWDWTNRFSSKPATGRPRLYNIPYHWQKNPKDAQSYTIPQGREHLPRVFINVLLPRHIYAVYICAVWGAGGGWGVLDF